MLKKFIVVWRNEHYNNSNIDYFDTIEEAETHLLELLLTESIHQGYQPYIAQVLKVPKTILDNFGDASQA